ncbi:hypothetical protein PLESTB_001598300 [Pleodorina starrii]|uniref:Uncharacterized protein n=1 Tax=Pleodorina starrii TaxID=330485 RepID=A0A9W6BYR6_9CHLO|nr:hypothetical protein PLESTM_001045100 [Pleodorina starrii]GLC60322.1 hypothetical protein PLESTB_001598300 [Pleodorina starrii]GLC77516.1 hypothetical protein PLESTF_001949800 [Pleodorina starrii]
MLASRTTPARSVTYACRKDTTRSVARTLRVWAELGDGSRTQQEVNPNVGAGKGPAAAEEPKTAEYYVGLIKNDIRQDNRASSNDMLVRNLQLAGGVAGVLGALLLAFMAANGLLPLPGTH